MALPSNVTYGTIVGRFLIATADSPDDSDRDPEGTPALDLKVTFSAELNPAVVRDATATPPTFFGLADVKATIGSDGTLLGPDGQPGVRLVASTNPALNPSGWTWGVKLFGTGYPNLGFSFLLDGGQTIDLGTVLQVPSNPGAALNAWLQAVADAQAARDAAIAAAASVPSAASLAATYAPLVKTVQAQQVRTVFDGSAQLAAVTPSPFAPISATSGNDVVVNPGELFQEILGGGAALTDAAAYNLTVNMSTAQRTALLTELFSPTQANWSTLRIGIGATDFQAGTQYTYDDMPAGQVDPNLTNFSVKPDQARIIPVLQQILAINPKVRIFAAVWSLPTWMLATGTAFQKQTFDLNNLTAWTNYIIKFLQAYRAYGIPIYSISIANEPHLSTFLTLPTATEQQMVKAIGFALDWNGFGDVKVLVNDDSWNNYSAVQDLLSDPDALSYIDSVAWHGYSATPLYMSYVRRKFPSVGHHLTEWRALQTESAFVEMQGMAGGYVAQGIRNWARSVTCWNLALDQSGNPTVTAPGRRGVVTVNNSTGAVTRNNAYYALTHMTKFVQPGARRCRSTSYSVPYSAYNTLPTALTTVAWVNPDGTVVLYAFNGSSSSVTFQIIDGRNGQGFPVTLASGELSTFTWGTTVQALPAGAAPTLTAPSVPTLTATGGNGQNVLSWTAPTSSAPLTGYTVLRGATSGDEVPIATLASDAASYLDSVAAGTYSYRLVATSIAGSATSASTAATAAAASAPSAPVLTVTTGTGKATLNWTAPVANGADVTSFTILRSTTSGSEVSVGTANKGATSYTDSGLTNGTPYFYTVKANNSVGASAASNEVSVTPTAPSVGTASTGSGTGQAGSGSSFTWSHTTASGDKVLVVLVSSSFNGSGTTTPTISSVTYGGAALTKQANVPSGSTGTSREVDVYTLANPPVGAAPIVVNGIAGSWSSAATAVAARAVTGTIGTPVSAISASATTLSTVTTAPNGIILTAAAIRSTSAPTLGNGQTSLQSGLAGTNMAYAHAWQSGGASQASSATWTTADNGSLVAIPIT